MGKRMVFVAFLVCAAACRRATVATEATHVDARLCGGCHAKQAQAYGRSGMSRSFARFRFEGTQARFNGERFDHAASGRIYRMVRRGDLAFMRRWQEGLHGEEFNVVEKRIDYIMGSGQKAQTFLHRNSSGELIELPVAWYSAGGGFWAMNPGYDRPDHEDFRRRIRYDCFFCHNAYPAVERDSFYADAIYPEALPEGIDCQRCHGSGSLHVKAASARGSMGEVRAAIVNPSRLSRDRAMEVCMQCHLQSTSRALPYSVQHFGRGVFSYRAGEPLSEYANHFDHAPGAGFDDKFEIAHAAYRLRQSKCFTASASMTCMTCHNPHHATRATQAEAACRGCHTSLSASHPRVTGCVSCHMPQRRTDDVVHVSMTDHRIQRHAPAHPLAPKRELAETSATAYRGRVAPYHPVRPDAMLGAVAQIRAGANLAEGIPELARLATGPRPEPFYELAEACWRAGDARAAFRWHEEALRRAPDFLPSLRSFGMELSASGELARGAEMLERANRLAPSDARTLHDLGVNYSRQGKRDLAIRTLRAAVAADPEAPETQNALGAELALSGDLAGAEAAFREAIRSRPDYALARDNLAKLRSGK